MPNQTLKELEAEIKKSKINLDESMKPLFNHWAYANGLKESDESYKLFLDCWSHGFTTGMLSILDIDGVGKSEEELEAEINDFIENRFKP